MATAAVGSTVTLTGVCSSRLQGRRRKPWRPRASLTRCKAEVPASAASVEPSVTLFTARSAFPAFNGWKMTILLEELSAAGKFGDAGFKVRELDLDAREHKEEWFLDINPNGRIPALVDHRADDYALFESGAIMQYLAEVYGDGLFFPHERRKRYDVVQWLFFQCAGVGPIQGQAHAFLRYVPEDVPYAIERFRNETRRLYEVLDGRLARSEYVAGDEYSIADMALYPWIAYHPWAGQDTSDLPCLQKWCEMVGARPAVQKGLTYNPKDLKELLANAEAVRRKVGATTLDRVGVKR